MRGFGRYKTLICKAKFSILSTFPRDIESRIPGTGRLRFIEVKGRVKGADTVTITKNEILTALNKPEQFILALVEVDGELATPCYVREPFTREPDFGVTSVNYKLSDLMARGDEPR